VFCFNQAVFRELRNMQMDMKHVFYVTDGAPSQYKNFKQFINIALHMDDFGCTAEQHYFATSHGKGPCDGVGALVKRAIRKASLQGKLLRNAEEITNFLKTAFMGMHIINISEDQIKLVSQKLGKRNLLACPIKGTRDIHCVKGIYNKSTCQIKVRFVSSEGPETIETIIKGKPSEYKVVLDDHM
jgi:hypothetical protein